MSTNILGAYLEKFKDWKYCPPSNHLWTVTFLLSSRGDKQNEVSTFATLYNNIVRVNTLYDATYSPLWKITTPNGTGDFVINSQDNNIGLFLVNELSFNGNSVSIQDTQSGAQQQYTGWLSYGKTQTGRNHNHAAKIKFAQSNWDFIEIFIDRWIAAIGQQGLIEDSSLPNIKANIIITEYACGVPGKAKNKGTWIPRKKITLKRAFPKNRQDNKLDYSPDSAGDMKYNLVDFEFDAYEVYYYDIFEVGYNKISSVTTGSTSKAETTPVAKAEQSQTTTEPKIGVITNAQVPAEALNEGASVANSRGTNIA